MHIGRLADFMPLAKYYKSLFIVTLLIFFVQKGLSQPLHSDLLKRTYLEYVNNLPKYLLTSKSAVVLIALNRSEALGMAKEIHPTFVKSGIDAVAYYYVDDLFMNDKLADQLSTNMDKREIKYIIVLQKDMNSYTMVITAHQDHNDYLHVGNKAWKMENKNLNEIGKHLFSQAYSMNRENFLIIDRPEFSSLDVELKGRRYEAYRPDLKSEKLAVRYFKKLEDPDSSIMAADASGVLKYIRKRNLEIEEMNLELERVFSNYPYPYEFVDASITDEELNNKELRYVLENIHSSNEVARSSLGFKEKTEVTEYVSVSMNGGQGSIKRIPANDIIFKYYVHHIPSKSNYLGTKWDADSTWPQALQNYLQLMVAEID